MPRSLCISLGIRKAIFYQPKLSGAPAFAPRNATNVVASGGHPAATFLIKRKWPKTVAALGFHLSDTPVGPEVRASLSLPRESDKERPGSKGRGPSAEGPPLRGRSALTGGPVPPCAPLPSGGISISAARRAKEIASLRGPPRPSPPAVRGGIWASATPWLGWFLPREAGLRRQSRHPRKANTERRSGRGTRV